MKDGDFAEVVIFCCDCFLVSVIELAAFLPLTTTFNSLSERFSYSISFAAARHRMSTKSFLCSGEVRLGLDWEVHVGLVKPDTFCLLAFAWIIPSSLRLSSFTCKTTGAATA